MRFVLVAVAAFLLFRDASCAENITVGSFYETAKEKCHDIASIRVEMDRINNDILILLAERTAYVKRAGDIKARTTQIADDPQRVMEQEKKITERSIEIDLPLEISIPAFRVIMRASIQYQQEYIDQLKLQEN